MVYTKIYHISDIHIRLYSRLDEYESVFSRLYEFLRRERDERGETGITVITGDVLHHKNELSPECIVFTRRFFENLATIFPVVVIAGNHDALLNNKSRMDSLSAILEPGIPNVHYLRESGNVRMENLVFGVFSLLDNGRPKPPVEEDGVLRVAMYHGGAGRFSTNKGFTMEGVPLSTFDGYDIVLLGDIHLFQYLDSRKRVAYAGSLISQNFTETDPDHGVLVWDVATRESRLQRIENPYAFRDAVLDAPYLVVDGMRRDINSTLSWDGILPSDARLNVILSRERTAEDISLLGLLARRAPGLHITEKPILKTFEISGTTIIDQDGDSDRCAGRFSETEMIKKYLDTLPSTWPERHRSRILETISSVRSDRTDERGAWDIMELRFDNMFGYGPGIHLDFARFPSYETVGIFGDNSAGKSSIIEVIVFLLYNQITRYSHGASVPREVIRFGETSSYGAIRFRTENVVYEIEKKMTLQKKSQKIRVDETLWRILPDGTREDLSEEQKKKTDKFIISKLGPCSQFLFTSVFLQQNEQSFRSLSPRDRKEFLYDILGLRSFDELHTQKTDEARFLKKEVERLEKELNRLPSSDSIEENRKRCEESIRILDIEARDVERNQILRRQRVEELELRRRPCPFHEAEGLQTRQRLMEQRREIVETTETRRASLDRKKIRAQTRSDRWLSHDLSALDLDEEYRKTWDALEVLYKKRMPEPTNDSSLTREEYEEWKNTASATEEVNLESLSRRKEACFVRLRPEHPSVASMTAKKIESSLLKKRGRYAGNEDELRSNIEHNTAALDAHTTEWSPKLKRLQELRARRAVLDARQDQVSDFAGRMRFDDGCDDCGHNRELLHDRIGVREEWCAVVEELRSLEAQCESASGEEARLRRLLEQDRALLEVQEALRVEIQRLEDATHNRAVRAEIQELDARIRKRDEDRKVRSMWEEWERRDTEITRVRFLNARVEREIRDLKDRLEDIREAQRIRDEAERAREDVRIHEEEMIGLEDRLRVVDEEIGRNAGWLEAARENALIETERRRLITEEEASRKRETTILQERVARVHELETWERHLEVRNRVSCDFDKASDEYSFLQRLLHVVGRDGIPMYMVEGYLPILEEQINGLLGSFLRGKSLSLKIERKKESATIHLFLKTRDQESVYVGGMEAFVIDAALKIAFARLSSRKRCNFFVIDEGISALDKKSMENLDQFFSFLEQFFPHVFIISHLREVQDHVRHSIHVIKEDAMSRLVC